MRIGFVLQDTSRAPTGLDAYTSDLWQALRSVDGQNEYVPVTLPARFARRAYLRALWEQACLPAWARRADIDVLHAPAGSAPVLRDRPCVLTLHDLGEDATPAYRTPLGPRLYFGRMVPWSARHATALLADSEATKRDAVARLGIDSGRITVVHLAPSSCYRVLPKQTVDAVRERYDLRDPYFLQVGAVIPRKNVTGAMTGFARFLADRPDAGTQFVVVGGRGFGDLTLSPEAEELTRAGCVRFLGHVPQDDLVALYNGALAVVLPSFFEGFGLPLVEAFACGTPAIASRVASLPEIGGDAALYVDPRDPDTIADAMERYSTPVLRAEMAERALERSRSFSWRRAAEQTLAVYRQAAPTASRRRAPAVSSDGDVKRPKVLFVRLDALGDLVLTTPCFDALKRRYPNAELHVVVQPATAPLIEHDPRVDRVHVLAAPWHGRWRAGAVTETLSLLRRLRAERYDYVLTLRRDLDDALFAHLCGGRETLGFSAPRTRPFLSRWVRIQSGRHLVENHLQLMTLLGCEVEGLQPSVRCSLSDSRSIGALLGRAAKPIALAPFASSEAKTLDPAQTGALVDRLTKEIGTPIVLLGGPADRECADKALARASSAIVDLVGRTSIPELCDVLRRCRLIVCADSAPMHLAVALGTPVVALFGGEDPVLWGPYGDTPRRVLQARDARGFPSVQAIAPAGVLEAVRELLAGACHTEPQPEEVAA